MEKATTGVVWVCIVSTLLMGCYSHTILSAESPQSAYEVSFRLKDGTFVLSKTYERVENGYRVVGTHVRPQASRKSNFAGILSDSQIKEVVTNEFSLSKTILAVVLPPVIIMGIGLLAFALDPDPFM
jgi:hypothetical protein